METHGLLDGFAIIQNSIVLIMVACMCISRFLVASGIQDKSCFVGLYFSLPETHMDLMVGLKVEVVNVFITSSSYCTLVFMHVHGICVCVALLRADFKIDIDTVGVQHSFSSEQPTHLPFLSNSLHSLCLTIHSLSRSVPLLLMCNFAYYPEAALRGDRGTHGA